MALTDEFTENGLTEEEQAIMDEIESEQENNESGEEGTLESVDTENATDEVADEAGKEVVGEEESQGADEPEEQAIGDEVQDNESQDDDEPVDDTPQQQFVPKFETGGDALDQINENINKADEGLKQLRTQYEEGGFDVDEFIDKRDQLFAQRSELATEKAIFENNIRNNEATDKQLWEHDQRVFFENKDNAMFNDNPVLFGALDATIKNMATDPENEAKTGAWFLNEAKKQVLTVFGADTQKPIDKKPEKPDIKPEEKDIPVTLSDIQASDENETTNNEFAHIDQLIESGDVHEAEKQLAMLSDSQQARFLQQTAG